MADIPWVKDWVIISLLGGIFIFVAHTLHKLEKFLKKSNKTVQPNYKKYLTRLKELRNKNMSNILTNKAELIKWLCELAVNLRFEDEYYYKIDDFRTMVLNNVHEKIPDTVNLNILSIIDTAIADLDSRIN